MKIKNNINKIVSEKKSKIIFVWNSSNDNMLSIKSDSLGISKLYIKNNDQLIESVNSFNYDYIKDDLEINMSHLTHLFNINEFYNSCSKHMQSVNKDIISEIYKIIGSIGQIIQMNIMVTFEKDNQQIFYTSIDYPIQNDMDRISILINCTINCSENNWLFKKEKSFSAGENLNIALEILGIAEQFKQYSPYSNNNWIDISSSLIDIILPSGIGGIFIHEAIGHCLEADTYFQNNSILYGKMNKRITMNNDINILDTCNKTDYIYYDYSSDGTKSYDVQLIKNGYIEGVLTNNHISKLYNIKDTGNGRSASFNDFSLPRMRNTYLANGKESKENILKDTKNGVLVTDIGGGNINPETGDFVFQIERGFLIENGEITNITKPFLFRGNVINALDRIDKIGNDLTLVEATCGKKGQMLKVSYGSPTIRIHR